jgi:hypothetical protein
MLFFGKPETTTNDSGIAGETDNTKSTGARQKSKSEPPGRRALPQDRDVSQPVSGSVEYKSQLSLWPAMTERDLKGTRPYQNFHYGNIDERRRAREHRIHLAA